MNTRVKNIMQSPINHLIAITAALLIVLTLFSVISFTSTQSYLSEIKKTNFQKLDSLTSRLTSNELNFDSTDVNGTHIQINPSDLQKITSQIKLLVMENQKETFRAESLIDKDYDRLSLYMALGIGFMTLSGVFMPILVNLITSIDTKTKLHELKIELGRTKTKLRKSDTEIKNIQKSSADANQGLNELKQNFDLSDVELAHLKIQNSVFRLLNIGAIGVLDFNEKEQMDYIIDHFKEIINYFNRDSPDSYTQSIVKDLRMVFKFGVLNILGEVENKKGFQIADEVKNILETYLDQNHKTNKFEVASKLQKLVNYFQEKATS